MRHQCPLCPKRPGSKNELVGHIMGEHDGIRVLDLLNKPKDQFTDGARFPYDEDGYCAWCGNGHWKHHEIAASNWYCVNDPEVAGFMLAFYGRVRTVDPPSVLRRPG